MKTIAYFIIYILTNSIVAQSVIVADSIMIHNDSILLPGTLKFNKSLVQQPLVIFVQGSGDPDRNGNQPSFNVHADYINQLGNALSEQNIAFFSYDKRNVTQANHKFIRQHYIFSDLVSDVKKIIDFQKIFLVIFKIIY